MVPFAELTEFIGWPLAVLVMLEPCSEETPTMCVILFLDVACAFECFISWSPIAF